MLDLHHGYADNPPIYVSAHMNYIERTGDAYVVIFGITQPFTSLHIKHPVDLLVVTFGVTLPSNSTREARLLSEPGFTIILSQFTQPLATG
jgi:hypothetical protein